MSNIVPQASSFNQGIWVQAENVAECYRDLATVYVYGGVVYNDTSNDYFLATHGIRAPDDFWKIVLTTDTTTVKAVKPTTTWPTPSGCNLSRPHASRQALG